MSLTGAFWISSTAMAAQGQALGAIGDNIANLNTGGYRRRDVNFSELLGHSDKFQAKSSGAKAGVTKRVETSGAYQVSDRGLNAAMNGRAMFVVSKDTGGADQYYTRFGAFEAKQDSTGTLRLATQNDYYLMGWPVADDGTVSTALQTIALPGRTQPLDAIESTSATVNDNLPALSSVGDQVTRSFSVYDAAGTLHNVDLVFENTGVNSWQVTASSTSGTIALATSPMPLTFDSSSGAITGTSSVALTGTWSNSESATIDVAFDGMTQWGEASAPRAVEVDGAPAGYVSSYYFDSDGFLNVAYSNGQVRPIYQIPGAVFRNASGLTEATGDVFKASQTSGAAALVDPQASELGKFLANTLELSNVDLAREMTNLIQTQRAYSTAATAFRTVDEMTTVVRDLT
ncbi:MAG: flagellar hook-basal body complex protein [Alphaproteobacteria bacterium]